MQSQNDVLHTVFGCRRLCTSTLPRGPPAFVQNVLKAGTRLGIPEKYEVGDILHVKIDALETPFGDMQLSLGGKVRRRSFLQHLVDIERRKVREIGWN